MLWVTQIIENAFDDLGLLHEFSTRSLLDTPDVSNDGDVSESVEESVNHEEGPPLSLPLAQFDRLLSEVTHGAEEDCEQYETVRSGVSSAADGCDTDDTGHAHGGDAHSKIKAIDPTKGE